VISFSQNFLFIIHGVGVRLIPLSTSATSGTLVPAPGDDEYRTVGGMRIVGGNRSTLRKPSPCHFVHHKSQIT
jgi:hypothetical protein